MQKNLKKYGWLFLLPTAVAFLFAFVAPFVLGVGLSFTRFRTVTDAAWVGLQNYVQAFTADSGFLHALWFTALFSGMCLPLHWHCFLPEDCGAPISFAACSLCLI